MARRASEENFLYFERPRRRHRAAIGEKRLAPQKVPVRATLLAPTRSFTFEPVVDLEGLENVT
jgi:hypothetical protein